MTTAAFNLTWDNTSDATFRVWATALDTQILAMGWVTTTDTGQATLASMTRGASGTNYRLYKSNDGVSPAMYLRIEYSGAAGSGSASINFQFGFATDGAGNISGTAASGRWCQSSSAANDTVARTCIISGSTSRLMFCLNMSATTLANSVFLSIERNKTSVGADTNTGAIITWFGGGTGTVTIAGVTAPGFVITLFLPTSGGVPGIESSGLACALSGNAAKNNTFGGTVGAAVPIPLAGSAQNPGLGILVCNSVEMPTRDTTVAVTMYDGNSHTYYTVGPNFTNIAQVGGSLCSTSRALLRYE